MQTLLKDIRYGLRNLRKRPLFTLVAVLTLSLGIGANSAVFSVVNAVLLQPLRYRESDRLALLMGTNPQTGAPTTSLSIPKFRAIKDQAQSFESIATIADDNFNLTGLEAPQQVRGARVSGDLFHVLAVNPYLGRTFLPDEDRADGPRVAIVSYGLWRRLFDTDANLSNHTIELDGQTFNIVGVLPSDFKFLDEKQEVWLPRAFEPSYFAADSINLGAAYVRVVGRLKPGVTFGGAASELATLSVRYREVNPANSDIAGKVDLISLQSTVVRDIRKSLLVTFAIVGIVLLIACANVTNLFLALAATRRREFNIRIALGATRFQLIRQVVTESLLLALLGGAGGMLLAYLGIQVLVAARPAGIPRLDDVGVDLRVLGFTLAVAVITGLFFGMVPAWQSSEAQLNQTLKDGGRSGSDDARGNRIRRTLVIGEVAMALVVLVCAGLLTQSFRRLRQTSTGLDFQGVLTMSVTLPQSRYPEAYRQRQFFEQVISRVRTLPGVTDAAVASTIPLIGPATGFRIYIEGVADPGAEKVPRTPGRIVGVDYFKVLRVPLIAGRAFTERDDDKSPQVAIVNQSFARRFWPSENPLGKHFAYSTGKIVCEVVGVVQDSKFKVSDSETSAEMFIPARQRPRLNMSLLVRTTVDPASLTPAIQKEILNIDRDQAITEVQTLEQVVADSIEQPRLTTFLLGTFGLVAMMLAAIGIYGVMAHAVAQRTREIGIRMALGAQTPDVLKLMIKSGMTLAVAGVAVGLAGAFVGTRLITSLLFEVAPTDATTFAAVSVGLLAVALLASYLPARRATKVDPLVALRCE